MARSTSSGPDSGALAYGCPVTGSMSSYVAPLAASAYSPSTKLRNVCSWSLTRHSWYENGG